MLFSVLYFFSLFSIVFYLLEYILHLHENPQITVEDFLYFYMYVHWYNYFPNQDVYVCAGVWVWVFA